MGTLWSAGLSYANWRYRNQCRPIAVLGDLEYATVDHPAHEFGAIQVGLAFQVFQFLDLLLNELDLCNFLCHSVLLSDSESAG